MKVKKVNLVYFSPNGTVYKTLKSISEEIGCETKEYDLTPFNARWEKYSFSEDDLVILGMPVYSGRLPNIAAEFFRGIQGNRTPAVFVVLYGNRDYEDALLELKNNAEQKGFVGIAAGAFIGEHSIDPQIGAGRPDSEDIKKAAAFGKQIKEKLENSNNLSTIQELKVKGNYPYAKMRDIPIAPSTNDNCDNCSVCIKSCPTLAINSANVKETDNFRCILCFKCIRDCPKGARYIDHDAFNEKVKLLKLIAALRREPELFI